MPDLLTPATVAELYHVHPATVARWLRDGLIPGASKPGHDWVIPEDALDKFQPPARGPRPAADRRRLLDRAREMLTRYPKLLSLEDEPDGTFLMAYIELARQAGVNRERARSALARAIRQARYHERNLR